MKEVIAILRPNAWQRTKGYLSTLGFAAFTSRRVVGRGRQRGLRYLPRRGAAMMQMRYLPKRVVTWVVDDDQVVRLVTALMMANRTGQIGDGKMFVCPVEDVVRVRTGETGACALGQERSDASHHLPKASP